MRTIRPLPFDSQDVESGLTIKTCSNEYKVIPAGWVKVVWDFFPKKLDIKEFFFLSFIFIVVSAMPPRGILSGSILTETGYDPASTSRLQPQIEKEHVIKNMSRHERNFCFIDIMVS